MRKLLLTTTLLLLSTNSYAVPKFNITSDNGICDNSTDYGKQNCLEAQAILNAGIVANDYSKPFSGKDKNGKTIDYAPIICKAQPKAGRPLYDYDGKIDPHTIVIPEACTTSPKLFKDYVNGILEDIETNQADYALDVKEGKQQ